MTKYAQKILDLAESLAAEETAMVAGKLLDWADVNRDTVEAFVRELTADNKEELLMQLQDILEDDNLDLEE